jgi:hypothetical protein
MCDTSPMIQSLNYHRIGGAVGSWEAEPKHEGGRIEVISY